MIEIEVDPHVDAAADESGRVPTDQAPELEQTAAVVATLGWTPEQAGQFVAALWNIGCVIYGPQWAADPRETAGWDFYCAQLLDQFLPRGMGGAVELGVGLVMIGNGLAMMTMRRWPLIKAGPRPIWVREKVDASEVAPGPEPPPPPAEQNGEGGYHNPYVPKVVPETRDWGQKL